MPYDDHFKLTDDLIVHLDTVVGAIADPVLQSRYTGFLAISAAAVLELSLKTMFEDFAQAKHKVFGYFVNQYFYRLNGRIKVSDIKDDYLKKCGGKYQTRFQVRLEALETAQMTAARISIKSSYANLLVCRHEFAHTGAVPIHSTYAEVKQGYDCGKQIMRCLAGCLNR